MLTIYPTPGDGGIRNADGWVLRQPELPLWHTVEGRCAGVMTGQMSQRGVRGALTARTLVGYFGDQSGDDGFCAF